MFGRFQENNAGSWGGGEGNRGIDSLCRGDSRILWAVRRLALMEPIGAARCHSVHIALQQEFGDAGLGVEHLLRCWLVGLSRLATRRLVIGEPACPMLLPDEGILLWVLHQSGHAPDAAGTALMELAENDAAAALVPLFQAVSTITQAA